MDDLVALARGGTPSDGAAAGTDVPAPPWVSVESLQAVGQNINSDIPATFAAVYDLPAELLTRDRQVARFLNRKTNKPATYEFAHQYDDGHIDHWYFQRPRGDVRSGLWEIHGSPDNRVTADELLRAGGGRPKKVWAPSAAWVKQNHS